MLTSPSSIESPAEPCPPASSPGLVRRMAVAFCAALQFLTIAPPVIRRPLTGAEMGRAVGFFPLIGLLLGMALVGTDWLLGSLFPPVVCVAMILAAWAVCTGAIHLDGFLDTCDGLFGGGTPDDRLRIMRDERVGAYAVVGGVLLLLVKFAALFSVPFRLPALLLSASLGRWGMALAMVAFPYARAEGLGRDMKNHAGWAQALLAGAISLTAAWFLGSEVGLVAWLVAGGFAIVAGAFVLRRLPGLTGDVYGAICELAEGIVLLVFVAGDRP